MAAPNSGQPRNGLPNEESRNGTPARRLPRTSREIYNESVTHIQNQASSIERSRPTMTSAAAKAAARLAEPKQVGAQANTNMNAARAGAAAIFTKKTANAPKTPVRPPPVRSSSLQSSLGAARAATGMPPPSIPASSPAVLKGSPRSASAAAAAAVVARRAVSAPEPTPEPIALPEPVALPEPINLPELSPTPTFGSEKEERVRPFLKIDVPRRFSTSSNNSHPSALSAAGQALELSNTTPLTPVSSRHRIGESISRTPTSGSAYNVTTPVMDEAMVNLSSAAASQANKIDASDVAAREPTSARIITSISAAFQRIESPKRGPEEPVVAAVPKEQVKQVKQQLTSESSVMKRSLIMERAAARLSAINGIERSRQSAVGATKKMPPNKRSDSAIAAAQLANPNAASKVAAIDLQIGQRHHKHRYERRFRPAAQWSTGPEALNATTSSSTAANSAAAVAQASTANVLLNLPMPNFEQRPRLQRSQTSLYHGLAPLRSNPSILSLNQNQTAKKEMELEPVKESGKVKSFFHKFSHKKTEKPGQQTAEQSYSKFAQETRGSKSNQRRNRYDDERTMRTAAKKTFNEEHPWKNHRKLNAPTERERKRYERLWAANKGSYIPFLPIGTPFASNSVDSLAGAVPPPLAPVATGSAPSVRLLSPAGHERTISTISANSFALDHRRNSLVSEMGSTTSRELVNLDAANDVHGYVVYRLWHRSRLGNETLAKIWDLVDLNKDGTLDREGFIIGTWLVDQCLYGRKLPSRIDNALWGSVGRLHVRLKQKTSHTHYHKSLKNHVRKSRKSAGHKGMIVVRKVINSKSSTELPP